MTRIVLCLAALLCMSTSLAACGGEEPDSSGDDAREVKAEMDALARELLPDLQGALGGAELGPMQAQFFEPGGNFGQWDYEATGMFVEPPGTAEEVLAAVEDVLDKHGLEVEPAQGGYDISATKGNVNVLVQRALESDVESVSGLNVTISSVDRLTSRDDFAESAQPEDYTAFVG